MRTVEKHPSLAEHLFNDNRVRKYGMMIIQHGLKGAAKKINPAALYIDAALSVIEAVNSYLNYARECERTKQILAENQKIKIELDAQLKIIKLKQETVLKVGNERIEGLCREIILNDEQRSNMLIQVRKHIQIANEMQKNLKEERENGINFEQLQKAQKSLDHLLRASLMFIINNID